MPPVARGPWPVPVGVSVSAGVGAGHRLDLGSDFVRPPIREFEAAERFLTTVPTKGASLTPTQYADPPPRRRGATPEIR